MKRSMTYGMLVLFLLFMITANPGDTGESGRSFVGWLSSGWDDGREFMGSLIGDEEADVRTNEFGEVVIPTVDPVVPVVPVEPQQPDDGVGETNDGGVESSG